MGSELEALMQKWLVGLGCTRQNSRQEFVPETLSQILP